MPIAPTIVTVVLVLLLALLQVHRAAAATVSLPLDAEANAGRSTHRLSLCVISPKSGYVEPKRKR